MEKILKIKVTNYPKQEKFTSTTNKEKVRIKSEELYAQLCPGDKHKIESAKEKAYGIISAQGFDNGEYSLYLRDTENKSRGIFHTRKDCENYVTLKVDYVKRVEEVELIKTILHEILGHALNSVNVIKESAQYNDIYVRTQQSGYENYITKYKKGTHKPVYNKKELVRIAYKFGKNQALDTDEAELLSYLNDTEIDNDSSIEENKQQLLDILIKSKEIDTYDITYEKKIGLPLNEGVTELNAINLATNIPEERTKLIEQSGYKKYLLPILNIENLLNTIDPKKGGMWLDVLINGQQSGDYSAVRKFIQQETGVKINPSDVGELNFINLAEKLKETHLVNSFNEFGLRVPKKGERLATFEEICTYPILLKSIYEDPNEAQQLLEMLISKYNDQNSLKQYVFKRIKNVQLPIDRYEGLILSNTNVEEVLNLLPFVDIENIDIARFIQDQNPAIIKKLITIHTLSDDIQLLLAKQKRYQMDLARSEYTSVDTLYYIQVNGTTLSNILATERLTKTK